jgi:hypothetical protein
MITFLLLTVGLIFFFIVLLFVGIAKKRRKPIYISLIFFLLAIPSGLYTSFLFAQKAYEKIKTTKIENPFKRRTGIEIYTALFDKPETNCVTVINSLDPTIPKVDCCIWLEFTTCPRELARIIADKELKAEETVGRHKGGPQDSTVIVDIPDYSPRPDWFAPENLGTGYKTLRKYDPDDPNHDLILYFSKDSTRAYYCDMAE